MIVTENLTKGFKKEKKDKTLAIDHINLEVKKGEIFGLIGPNGAGKTTFLKILSTLILPDEGTAIIDEHDVVKDADLIKNKVSLLAGEFVRSLYWRLDGGQNMKFFANMRNMWHPEKRINELLDIFNLREMENELVMKYSTGMKHKLALAVGLLNNPPVIFLDEPLTGIDPITSYEIKQLIKKEFKDKTIIWTSHNLYEMEEMCNRIALINKGKIILEGTPEELKKNYWDYEKIMFVCDNSKPFELLENVLINGNTIQIETKDANKTFFEIMQIAKDNDVKLIEIKTLKPSLEDVFMRSIKNV